MAAEEKDAQAECEKFTKEAAAKRVIDSKPITDKEGAKADVEATEIACCGVQKTPSLKCSWLPQNAFVFSAVFSQGSPSKIKCSS